MVTTLSALTDVDIYEPTTGEVLIYNEVTQKWENGPQSGGGGTPGGSTTQVQFNDGGSFGGDAGMTYNKTTDVLTIVGVTLSGKTASKIVATDSSKNLDTPYTFRDEDNMSSNDATGIPSQQSVKAFVENTSGTGNWTDYSSGSTITGWSSYTTKIIRYKQQGKLVHIHFNIAGTSNSATTDFTLPIATGTNGSSLNLCYGVNNGTANIAYPSWAASSSTVGFARYTSATAVTSSWTASGTKQVTGQFIYEID